MTTFGALGAVAAVIQRQRFRYTSEAELQDGIALALNSADIAFEREVRLTATDRIDFLLRRERVGIEVKAARRWRAGDVLRQLDRYARHDDVAGLILITDRRQLARQPAALRGKPLLTLALLGGIT